MNTTNTNGEQLVNYVTLWLVNCTKPAINQICLQGNERPSHQTVEIEDNYKASMKPRPFLFSIYYFGYAKEIGIQRRWGKEANRKKGFKGMKKLSLGFTFMAFINSSHLLHVLFLIKYQTPESSLTVPSRMLSYIYIYCIIYIYA